LAREASSGARFIQPRTQNKGPGPGAFASSAGTANPIDPMHPPHPDEPSSFEPARGRSLRGARPKRSTVARRAGSRDSAIAPPSLIRSPQSIVADETVRQAIRSGLVIPAHPLALAADRRLDERRQRGLTRYYVAAGAGGVAVGVHTTQFAIRDSRYGLYRPVLELAIDEARLAVAGSRPFAMIAGICGHTAQARGEAELAAALGYDAGLLSLGDWRAETEHELLD